MMTRGHTVYLHRRKSISGIQPLSHPLQGWLVPDSGRHRVPDGLPAGRAEFCQITDQRIGVDGPPVILPATADTLTE